MAKEIERRFLYVGDYNDTNYIDKLNIKQGYIFIGRDKQCRVRIINNNGAFIAIKIENGYLDRDEYEYAIPLSDAIELYSKCKLKVEKVRNNIKYGTLEISIDVYTDGLKVAEIELPNKNYRFTIPDFLGKEITGIKKYTNISIAKRERRKRIINKLFTWR